jgi:hypothetical protein
MSSLPGEAYQFDWRHKAIKLQNVPLTIKAAHVKLSHSSISERSRCGLRLR